MENKKFSYSKFIPIITGILFASVIFFTMFMLSKNNDYSDSYTVFVTVIGAAGSLFATSIIWYMKKAQAENTYKLDMTAFKSKSEIELEHFEKMLKLKKKYKLNDDDINYIKNESDIDELTSNTFLRLQNNIENAINEANSPIEIEHIQ